jgi:hypothetical protein
VQASEELLVGPQDIFKGNDIANGPSLQFLAKLADVIVTLRQYSPDSPVLRQAIVATVLHFFQAQYSDQVSEIASLIEMRIPQNLEFQLLGK